MLHTISCISSQQTPLPQQFTNPFSYTPHPLCIAAAEQVRNYVHHHDEWIEEIARGKMFGVLIVDEQHFLAAFSGQLNGQSNDPFFVPPVFDLDTSDHYVTSMLHIKQMDDPAMRREHSEQLQDWIFNQYKCLNAKGETATVMQIFEDYYRRHMLHPEHFARNARTHHIPSGTGECCEPKLLQYAYAHQLQPRCMAMFWMGDDKRAADGELRHDHQFYPACNAKCRPLLDFMLRGLCVEESLQQRREKELLAQVEVIYSDDSILAINKPSGLLSVPGRSGEPSVLDAFPADSIYYPAHRLDQATSGLLLIARTQQAYVELQKQFTTHQVCKHYIAKLDGIVRGTEGIINLPLRPDPDDRPRQQVDLRHGRRAVTRWHLSHTDGQQYSYVDFFPETGRTHQLRVHAAHPQGLGCPIVGDTLYGRTYSPHDSSPTRLMLHAASLTFRHPTDGHAMTLEAPLNDQTTKHPNDQTTNPPNDQTTNPQNDTLNHSNRSIR